MIAFIKKWGWLLLFAAGGILGWFVSRRRSNPIPDIQTELKVIRAETTIRKMELEYGRAEALQEVERRYVEQKIELAEEQRLEAETLKNDPVALSAFLVRAGARRR